MAKKITIKQDFSIGDIELEIKKTRDGRYRLRLQAVMLATQGLGSTLICKRLLINRKTLFVWIKLYNDKGLEGLRHISLGGRDKGCVKWDNEIFTALFNKLDAMEEFYSVPKMQVWIKETYDATIPQNTIHNRLRDNGYTFKSSRPNPYKGDPNLQASFKKMA